jgi:hypothetical protein
MNLFSDSLQLLEELLRKSMKVKRKATLGEADMDSAWLTEFALIARRCRDDKILGTSRYPYKLSPGVSPCPGGYFEHREWAVRRGMERHPSLRLLFCRPNQCSLTCYVDDNSCWLVSSLPLYVYTMTSHRDIYTYKC